MKDNIRQNLNFKMLELAEVYATTSHTEDDKRVEDMILDLHKTTCKTGG
jgi:hypothetical protein